MARKSPHPEVSRRKFLAGVAVAGAATTVASPPDVASAAAPPIGAAKIPTVLPPTAHQIAIETEIPKDASPLGGRAGSDFMVDVIRSTGIEYLYANPASSYRGIHESLINYGGNTKPEFIECMHEESSIAMAHGYYKATGKLAGVLVHGTVGLMHGTMAIYNAFCDRAPVLVMGGNDLDASKRPPGVPTTHSAQDINALVRDFTKWDDTPVSLQHFAQSFVRATKLAMTPPHAPVMLTLDAEVQESPIKEHERNTLSIPKLFPTAPPQAEVAALREAAKLLVAAQNPVIVVDRVARSPNGVKLLVELAELLQVPIMDIGGRMNFPNTHYLDQSARGRQLVSQADLVFGMEMTDFWNIVNGFIDNADNEGTGLQERRIKPDTKLITLTTVDLTNKSNYQDAQRFQPADIQMVGDAEASLPSLIEAVKSAITNKSAYDKRGEAMKKAWGENRDRARAAAAVAWDASPITTARLSAEIYDAVKDQDWSLVASTGNVSGWPRRLWKMDKHYQWLGSSGGSGLGYGAPASAGAAHGNKSLGRFSVSIQGDGDLMYAPGVLWTCAHHSIPLMYVMHNNRGYHQEVMHIQRLSNRRNRVANNGKDFGPIGTKIQNPDIDYASLAKSMGMQAIGPINDPKDLGPALKRAVQIVKAGEPVLVDSVTQPR
jgi:thiamine pyrophosphate-dependent acetolactate synthase large subunit-like protein